MLVAITFFRSEAEARGLAMEGISFWQISRDLLYPSMIVVGCRPDLVNSNAFLSNSARMRIVVVVPSLAILSWLSLVSMTN